MCAVGQPGRLRSCFRQVVDVDVERQRCKHGSLWDAVLQSSQPALLSVAGHESEAVVGQDLHHETYQVLVRYSLREFQMESS